MENVVYITGAGFSAFTGLPVMNNFMEKAKDIYIHNADEYDHFESVFNYINDLSSIKTYFESDLTNIEEILSIIEMGESVGGKDEINFQKFIKDTIEYYTPQLILPNEYKVGKNNLWGNEDYYKLISTFLLSMLNVKLKTKAISVGNKTRYVVEYLKKNTKKHKYTLITLNYDLLIENFFDEILSHRTHEIKIKNPFLQESNTFNYYKLHGSVETDIIPPTWNKILNENIIGSWEGAYDELTKAHHIRFLGYSLPTSDSYLKYFLKSALSHNQFLKTVDVICLDPYDSVKNRYRNFVNHNKFRFSNSNIEFYLRNIYNDFNSNTFSMNNDQVYYFSSFERIHNNYLN